MMPIHNLPVNTCAEIHSWTAIYDNSGDQVVPVSSAPPRISIQTNYRPALSIDTHDSRAPDQPVRNTTASGGAGVGSREHQTYLAVSVEEQSSLAIV